MQLERGGGYKTGKLRTTAVAFFKIAIYLKKLTRE